MIKRGILLHISSLRGPYGCGSLGKEAYQFVDFLVKTHQSYWQILPIGPTSYGDSPYQTLSTFAGNPYFICLDTLASEGLLTKSDLEEQKIKIQNKVDYGFLFNKRITSLKKAYNNFLPNQEYLSFIEENKEWLNTYALFMHLKTLFNYQAWITWPSKYRLFSEDLFSSFYEKQKDEISLWFFIQYQFYKQFKSLKTYANKQGIKIIGDIPIYVAYDSVDVWSNPKNYHLDENLQMKAVAGVPPDLFTADGQLWGNPLYDYQHMEKDDFSWWKKRLKQANKLFDVIRVDHFRGFEAYYVVGASEKTARSGHWEKAPGLKLWQAVKKEIPNIEIIAEDLGFLTPEVHKLVEDLGFPGMKILQFSLASPNPEDYPEYFKANTVIYTGTHDNPPLKAWLKKLPKENLFLLTKYLKQEENLVEEIIKCALRLKGKIIIIPIQDYLNLGSSARLNTPGTKEKNWTWRLAKNHLTKKLINKINNL